MVDITTLRSEVTAIVNNLAKAVVAEIFTAAEKLSLNRQKPEAEDRLGTLVDSLCVEAVDRIVQVCAAPCDVSSDGEKEGAAGDPAPTDHTYILLYGAAAPVDSRCVLMMSLQSAADGEDEGSVTAPPIRGSAPSPPPQADLPDHEYARPSPPPPPAAAPAKVGGVSAARSNRRTDRRVAPPTETADVHHRCSQCAMLFPNAERLSAHHRKSHPLCSACGERFSGVLKLREHERRAHGLLPFTCDFCAKTFSHRAHRDLHVRARHTGEKSCHCDICGRGFCSTSVLKTHRVTHFDKTFTCDVCGRSFFHAAHLTRHKLVHLDERPHRCATCGRGFTQAANLRSHQAVHSGERQLCSVCGRSYRRLKNHVISKHSHELPADAAVVSCDVCGKKFAGPSQLRVHRRRHTGEKPFHCELCGRSYRLKELLRQHRLTHGDQKPYSCSLCSKTFKMASSFLRHRSIHSGETPHSCSLCGKHFRLLTFLNAHLQTKAHLKQLQLSQGSAPDLTQ